MQPTQPKTLPNPNEDLIEVLDWLEKIKQKTVVRKQSNLLSEVAKLQSLFAQTLVDSLNVAPGGLVPAEMALARENNMPACVKLIKDRLSCGINEAKELMKNWQVENNVDPFGGQR